MVRLAVLARDIGTLLLVLARARIAMTSRLFVLRIQLINVIESGAVRQACHEISDDVIEVILLRLV